MDRPSPRCIFQATGTTANKARNEYRPKMQKAAAAMPRRLFRFERGSRIAWVLNREEVSVLGRPGSDLLFQVLRLSTIGAGKFDGRVRDGIGYRLPANTTRPAKNGMKQAVIFHALTRRRALKIRAIKPNERLVPVSSTRCRAYTPGLSTWWSTTALKGELVSRWVSRLDAFSDYPVRT